jgi:predicted transcriptional regulator
MKKIVIGILPQVKIRERMLAIARGDYKPKRGEPKVWFTSMKSMAEVLSDKNRALLHVIAEVKPESLQDLAEVTDRKPSNLSRTLKTLESYGFVELRRKNKKVMPVAKATEFEIHAA